jgi:predicted Fe-Mo cluster-binding NifX family protein
LEYCRVIASLCPAAAGSGKGIVAGNVGVAVVSKIEVQAMKVVVTSQGTRLDSPVDPRFGRAKHFVFVDTESGEHTAHDNSQNLNAPQGAGIQAAQAVARLGAEAVLTGHVGPKAFATLRAAGITIYTDASGRVGETVDQLKAGRLTPASKADVEGHWA